MSNLVAHNRQDAVYPALLADPCVLSSRTRLLGESRTSPGRSMVTLVYTRPVEEASDNKLSPLGNHRETRFEPFPWPSWLKVNSNDRMYGIFLRYPNSI